MDRNMKCTLMQRKRLVLAGLAALAGGQLLASCELLWKDAIISAGKSTIVSLLDPQPFIDALAGDDP